MSDFHRLSRRTVLLGGAAVFGGAVLGPSLAGCSPLGAEGARPLKFWHLLSGGDGIVMAGLVDAANEANPEFHAAQTVLAWGTPYYTKLAMASVGGRAPDVAIMHASRLPGYAPGGLLDPWDLDLLEEFGVTEADFPERIWEKGIIDGDLFSIALDAHPFIMMYNTDVAEQAGVLGDDGQLVEITSPEQFLEVARAMQQVTGRRGLSYGYLGDGAQMWRLFYTFYKQQDAEMSLEPGEPAQMDEDAAVTALDFIKQLLDGEIAATNGDYATAVAEFVNGESGMFFTGVWELPTAVNAGIPFDAQPIPNLFGTPAAYADSHAFVLPHQSEPDEAQRREVYRFVASILKGSFDWAGAGHIPAYSPIIESDGYADLVPQAHYASAADVLNYDPPAWFTGSGSDFQTYFAENVQGVFRGGDSREGIQGFVRRLNVLLAKPNPVA
ncbi:extracellular solute-binding protein [Mycetocola manganoxydans]|uniref:Extracellular solute-binding protein n=1 Tax=Mycetocola manganoxydans TaxID=699879 RepID=A0A3L6ZPE8_9MICO|nr:extracellular solute-binding protein [Mycetocola manganoxydans]RLP69431.1 extracellular solute-binding protein [Mycetocola manganoxydans]GHD50557.1 carbohydrate-binding protein [Mycetocola manganoxydans]